MENIARLMIESGLDAADQASLDALKKEGTPWIGDGETRIYRRSLYVRDGMLYFVAATGTKKHLYVASRGAFERAFQGTHAQIDGLNLLRADFTPENADTLHKVFPFTAPLSLRDKKTTMGCGDRLGLATPGHVRAAMKYKVYPVLAQQSIRELTLTGRDYPHVVADATFLVFQEGYERG
jgi:hypothetical protein